MPFTPSPDSVPDLSHLVNEREDAYGLQGWDLLNEWARHHIPLWQQTAREALELRFTETDTLKVLAWRLLKALLHFQKLHFDQLERGGPAPIIVQGPVWLPQPKPTAPGWWWMWNISYWRPVLVTGNPKAQQHSWDVHVDDDIFPCGTIDKHFPGSSFHLIPLPPTPKQPPSTANAA